MTTAQGVVQNAAAIRLDFGEDVLTFPYTNSAGEEWEGCLEEWIGNEPKPLQLASLVIERDGTRYYQLGASGGGADLILVRDDETCAICYLNDFDLTISQVATDIDRFVGSLRQPE